MPSCNRSCPLCSKSVAASKIGVHLLSAAHTEELASYRPGDSHCPGGSKEGYLVSCKDKMMEKRMIHLFAAPGMTKKMFVCFGCHTAREKDDLEHFKKHPNCLEAHRAGCTKFLAYEVKSAEVKNAETEMRLRRQAEKQKKMWEELSEEFAAYKEAVSKLLGKKREDGDDLELSDIQKLLEEVEVVEQEDIPAPDTSLPGKGTLSPPAEKVLESSTLDTFQTKTEPFPGREVLTNTIVQTSPPQEVSQPLLPVKKAKKSPKQAGYVPPVEETPIAPPFQKQPDNRFMGLGSEELSGIKFESLNEEDGQLFIAAWEYAQAEGL